jgi:hypothetical protein
MSELLGAKFIQPPIRNLYSYASTFLSGPGPAAAARGGTGNGSLPTDQYSCCNAFFYGIQGNMAKLRLVKSLDVKNNAEVVKVVLAIMSKKKKVSDLRLDVSQLVELEISNVEEFGTSELSIAHNKPSSVLKLEAEIQIKAEKEAENKRKTDIHLSAITCEELVIIGSVTQLLNRADSSLVIEIPFSSRFSSIQVSDIEMLLTPDCRSLIISHTSGISSIIVLSEMLKSDSLKAKFSKAKKQLVISASICS